MWAGVGIGETVDHLETTVGTLSARATSGGIFVLESDALTVDDVEVTVQRVGSDGTTLTPTTDATQSDVRTTSGDGDIVLRTTAGDIVLNDGTQPDDDTAISADGSGNVFLTADTGSLLAVETAITEGNHLVLTAGVNIGEPSDVFDIDAVTLDAETTADGSMWITDVAGGVAVGLVDAGEGDVTLTALDGSITDADGNNTAEDLIAATLNLVVTGPASNIGNSGTNLLDIDADHLNASTEGGNIWLNDRAGGVAVGLVDAGGSSGGDIILRATNGSIIESGSDPEADIVGNRGTLEVTGPLSTIGTMFNALEVDLTSLSASTQNRGIWILDTAGGMSVYDVDAGTGTVNLTTVGGDLTEAGGDSAADVIGSTLTLEATAGGTIGEVAQYLDIDAATLNALTAGGNMWMTDMSGGVGLGLLDAGGTLGGDVYLTARNGSILEAGMDPGAEVIANRITFTVTGPLSTIGSLANTLEIDGSELSATTQRGSMWINDIDGGIGIGSMTAGVGTINLTATNGSIVEAGGDSAPEIVSRGINLQTTGAGNVGESGNFFALDAEVLNISTEGGSIWVTDTAGGVALGSIDAGGYYGGSVYLAANGGYMIEDGADPEADLTGSYVALWADLPYTIGLAINPIEFISLDNQPHLMTPGILSYFNILPK